MVEYKFKIGEKVRHKLTEDYLIVLNRWVKTLEGNSYECRLKDYRILEFKEAELERTGA